MSWKSLNQSVHKVAITGATSATAMWMARVFFENGIRTHALCSQQESFYSGLKKERLQWLKTIAHVHFDLRAERNDLSSWIRENKPSIWIHHHHLMKDYKSQNYNYEEALKEGIEPLDSIFKSLQPSCQGIIYTGSYFESGEGGKEAQPASPYGQSKTVVGEELKSRAKTLSLPFSKIILPDCVGPLENSERFIPKLLQAALAGETFQLFAPKQIADHLPLEAVGRVYFEEATNLLNQVEKTRKPSGWIAPLETGPKK